MLFPIPAAEVGVTRIPTQNAYRLMACFETIDQNQLKYFIGNANDSESTPISSSIIWIHPGLQNVLHSQTKTNRPI